MADINVFFNLDQLAKNILFQLENIADELRSDLKDPKKGDFDSLKRLKKIHTHINPLI